VSQQNNQRWLIKSHSLTQINESNVGRCAKYAVFGKKGAKMLSDMNVDQAHFIAILAGYARRQRDLLLGNVAEGDLGGLNPGRGEHNPTAALGFEPLPPNETTALRDAVAALSERARGELYTLMRIGQDHLAAKKWHRGLSEAALLGDQAITAAIIEDADLHDHIMKGLYEAKPSA
jgi:hypothetical protein